MWQKEKLLKISNFSFWQCFQLYSINKNFSHFCCRFAIHVCGKGFKSISKYTNKSCLLSIIDNCKEIDIKCNNHWAEVLGTSARTCWAEVCHNITRYMSCDLMQLLSQFAIFITFCNGSIMMYWKAHNSVMNILTASWCWFISPFLVTCGTCLIRLDYKDLYCTLVICKSQTVWD